MSDGVSKGKAVLLEALELSARHGTAEVLQGLSLACEAGQWLCLVGPNGAGKSSLLRCLAGLMPVRAGQVKLAGRPLASWPHRERAQRLAWLPQHMPDASEVEALSVYDTVALGRLPHQGWLGRAPSRSTGVRDADAQAIEQALLDTDTLALTERHLTALSGGERQRVWLARALAVQAQVLLLDEPASHLDAPHVRLLARVLRQQAARGCAVLSAVHELSLALMADRVAVMAQGRLVALGERDDPSLHRAIESVFDQAVAIERVQDRWVAVPQA